MQVLGNTLREKDVRDGGGMGADGLDGHSPGVCEGEGQEGHHHAGHPDCMVLGGGSDNLLE